MNIGEIKKLKEGDVIIHKLGFFGSFPLHLVKDEKGQLWWKDGNIWYCELDELNLKEIKL